MILYVQSSILVLFILFIKFNHVNQCHNYEQDLIKSTCCLIRNNDKNEHIDDKNIGLSYMFFNTRPKVQYKNNNNTQAIDCKIFKLLSNHAESKKNTILNFPINLVINDVEIDNYMFEQCAKINKVTYFER